MTIRILVTIVSIGSLVACSKPGVAAEGGVRVDRVSPADGGPWLEDFNLAMEKAANEKKLVLLFFTGSDWCPPCIKMEQDVFSTRDFLSYAEKNLVLVRLDFGPDLTPKSGRFAQNHEQLFKSFGVVARGFPTFVLLNSAGKPLGVDTGYLPGGPKAFIDWIEKVGSTQG